MSHRFRHFLCAAATDCSQPTNVSSTGNCQVLLEGVSESGTGQDDEYLAVEEREGHFQVYRFGGSQ